MCYVPREGWQSPNWVDTFSYLPVGKSFERGLWQQSTVLTRSSHCQQQYDCIQNDKRAPLSFRLLCGPNSVLLDSCRLSASDLFDKSAINQHNLTSCLTQRNYSRWPSLIQCEYASQLVLDKTNISLDWWESWDENPPLNLRHNATESSGNRLEEPKFPPRAIVVSKRMLLFLKADLTTLS
jgi:hypothetical protein